MSYTIFFSKPNIHILLTAAVLVFFNSCKSNKTEKVQDDATLLVQLKDVKSINTLEKEFVAYELTRIKLVSRPMFIYLVSYSTDKIDEEELIGLLKNSSLVKEAQPNREVNTRN